MYELSHCPICSGSAFKQFLSCIDYTVSHDTFSLLRCENCSFLFTSPRPKTEELFRYYMSDEYISHSNKPSSIVAKLYQLTRLFTLQWKIRLVMREVNSTAALQFLDFGCGTGDFLRAVKLKGHLVTGVEPSAIARAQAERKLNQPVFKTLADIKGEFHAITLWHVLEHIPDLNQTIGQLKLLLSKNGTMFIAVPNHKSYDAQFYQRYWAAYDVPRHLWHFNQQTMTQLLNNHGLHLRKIIPMKLDSFYVSMLSEKCKSGKTTLPGLIKGFVNGLRSNLAQSNKEYSSLIYVVQK